MVNGCRTDHSLSLEAKLVIEMNYSQLRTVTARAK